MVNADEYRSFDGLGLANLVRTRQVSPAELLETALGVYSQTDAAIHAVVYPQLDSARQHASRHDLGGPFAGVPFLLKDLGCEATAFPSSMGSRLYRDHHYSGNSELFDRIEATGLVTFGRTTSPEFGIGPTSEAGVYDSDDGTSQPTRNPWNLAHVAGGSSGGSAAAVAAGIVPMAHGSDGGGSVRIPASSCGLFGLKPSRARLPDGPFAGEGWAGMAIDGFLTRSVADSAALLDATHGPDIGAPYFAPAFDGSYLAQLKAPTGRLRIAYTSRSFTGAPTHPECHAAVSHAATICSDLGHDVFEDSPPIDVFRLMQAWTVIVACGTHLTVRARQAELHRPLWEAHLDAVTRGAMIYGATLSGADYLQAVSVIHDVGRQMAQWLKSYDVLLTPTLAEPPAQIGRFAPLNDDFVDYRMGPKGVIHYSPYTALANATGQPAMSVPTWWSSANLPVGTHYMANVGDEVVLLQLAAQLEQAVPWFHRVAAL